MPETHALPPGPAESSARQLYRLVDEPYGIFQDAYREHGPIFTLRILGQAPWVMVADPEAVRTIFRASADEIHADADAIKSLLGRHAILFRDGESHRRERRILTPPFKHERMVAYAERMLARTDDALLRLRPGDELTMQALVVDVTLRVIVECVFGVSAPTRRDRLSALFARHIEAMQTAPIGAASMAFGGERLHRWIERGTDLRRARAQKTGPLPSSTNPLLRFFDTKAEMDAMLLDEIARCRREAETRDDVLAMLVNASYDDGETMPDEVLVDELFALLIGGHETSGITLAWAVWFLLQHPHAMAAVREELEATFGDGPVTARGVERMRYLHAVLDETLRLRTVATGVPRKLAHPTTLGGFELPAGTSTFPCAAVLHFREDLWPDAEAFKPERFLGERPSPFHYLPFGGGSRACLGRPFAQVEMRLVLAEILHRVDMRLSPRAATVPAMRGILIGPSDGVPIVIDRVRERRSSASPALGATP